MLENSNQAPIRILHYGLTNNLGGIEVFVMSLYRHMDRSKVQFDFISHEGIYFENEIKKLGGKIYDVPKRREHFFEYKNQLKKIIRSNKYTAVHVHALAVSNIDIIKIALKNNVKVILHSHMDMDLRNFRAEVLHKYNRKWLENKKIYRFACSTLAAKWIHGENHVQDTIIFHNAIDTEKFKYNIQMRNKIRREFNFNDDELVIGHVGRFAYQKNQEFLINIFKEILHICPNSKLLLVGGEGGMMEVSKTLVDDLNLNNKVIFTGIRDDVNDLMQAMDIFVFPSRWEGLGIVLIEAQATGMLCFTSDKVPNEAKVTDNLEYISLEKNYLYWAECILDKYADFVRKDVQDQLISEGYDIYETSSYIQNFYLKLEEE